MEFKTYQEAREHAQSKADELGLSYGIEKPTKYQDWTVKLIPHNPNKRFGWELRCETVEPSVWEKTWAGKQVAKGGC